MSRVDSVGLAKQTGAGEGGLGTKNVTPSFYVPVESADTGTNTEEMTREETLGHQFPTDPDRGVQFFEPSLSGACRSASLPRLLSMFLGDPLTTTPDATGAPSARNHNFNPVARPTPRAHSLLLNRTDPSPAITDLLWDAIGNSLTLQVSTNDWMAFEASLVAAQVDESLTEPSVTADLTRRFAFYETKAYLTIGGGAEAEIAVADVSLTYNLNVDTDQAVLGSRRLYKVQAGNADCEVSFTAKQDIGLFYRRALALTPQNVKLRVEALGPIIGGAIAQKVVITLPRLFEIEAPVDIAAGETLKDVGVTARAAYDATTSKFVEVDVVNVTAAY